MGNFAEKLKTMVPVVRRKQKLVFADNAVRTISYATLESLPQAIDFEVPYLKPVKEFLSSTGDIEGKRIFVAAEDETTAMKAVLGLLAGHYCVIQSDYYGMEIDSSFEDEDFQEAFDENFGQLRVVDMSVQVPESNGGNPYAGQAFGIDGNSKIFFTGLEEDDKLSLKLDVIKGCGLGMQFVRIDPGQLEKPWVRDLMMDKECEILRIPGMEVSYCVQILEELLRGERYMLVKDLKPLRLVRGIRKKRGNKFGEEDIAWSLDQAVKQVPKREKRFVLEEKDFSFTGKIEERPMERLSAMAGLGNVKTMIHEYAALGQEQMRNSRLENICSHMVFSGRPGTGKTECARIIAEIMAEQGQNNGNFVLASRKDIVGKYIGQTAPKVANLFRQARSGVLFVDEAGFFLQDSTRGSYNQEAIKEFVRYMETYQDVTVIFALYPHEVEAWMELDAGLSSRISRIVRFEDYTEEELVQIAAYMSGKRGYCMEKAAEAQIAEYIRKRKDALKEKFGNAREIRKLVESAIFARSIRVYNRTGKNGKLVLKASDFAKGAERLMQEEEAKAGKKKAPIGFAMMKEEDDGWNHADQERLPKGKCSAVSMN